MSAGMSAGSWRIWGVDSGSCLKEVAPSALQGSPNMMTCHMEPPIECLLFTGLVCFVSCMRAWGREPHKKNTLFKGNVKRGTSYNGVIGQASGNTVA